MSCTNDFISDLKLFLVTVSYDVKHYRNSKEAMDFRNIIRNIFKDLDIDWENGWDNYERTGATDILLDKLDIKQDSDIFNDFDYLCIDIIQSLITLPLKPKSYKNLNLSLDTFLIEFRKIEKQVKSPIIHMYFLREIVNIARELKTNYKINTRETTQLFKRRLLVVIDDVISYFNSKDISYEKMLCSLYVFADCCEGVLHEQVQLKIQEQDENYRPLRLRTPEHMFACIETNIPSKYRFNRDSKFLILDSVNNDRVLVDNVHPLVIDTLNETKTLKHGTIVIDYVTGKLDEDIKLYS